MELVHTRRHGTSPVRAYAAIGCKSAQALKKNVLQVAQYARGHIRYRSHYIMHRHKPPPTRTGASRMDACGASDLAHAEQSAFKTLKSLIPPQYVIFLLHSMQKLNLLATTFTNIILCSSAQRGIIILDVLEIYSIHSFQTSYTLRPINARAPTILKKEV